jgi:hypothetical protein
MQQGIEELLRLIGDLMLSGSVALISDRRDRTTSGRHQAANV